MPFKDVKFFAFLSVPKNYRLIIGTCHQSLIITAKSYTAYPFTVSIRGLEEFSPDLASHSAATGFTKDKLSSLAITTWLAPKLLSRSEGSIEFKHQNISGVLVELGLPYIEWYKPRSNYQGILLKEVESFLENHPGFLDKLAVAPTLNPEQVPQTSTPNLDKIIEDPPEKTIAPKSTNKPWLSRKSRKIDFAELDAANRRLGKLGEQFVFDLERHRLEASGRDDLAQRVVWASQDIGDGLGFDIISFDEADDSERMIEVKATGLGKFFPFYVT
ncbi:MAG TPA: DUF3883 domain-containing protein, partial [Gemmatales bacterium]|nr:DUF3883 domain-containing protein [Gemmatales bacterium]